MFRLKELREENGLKRSELARDLNINEPYIEVSPLLSGPLSSNERKIIANYRELDSKGRDRVIEYIGLWKNKNN